MQIEER